MSGVGEIASIVGLTDVALKGVHGLYNLIRDLRNVPEELQGLYDETASLQDKIARLEFLKGKDQAVSAEVAAVGIDAAIEKCETACEDFRKRIQGWVKSESPTLRERVRVLMHKSEIKRLTFTLWSTERRLEGAISILTLQLVHADKTEHDKRAEVDTICARFLEWKTEAKKERKQIGLAIVELDEDSDSEDARAELDEESRIANEFLRSCDDVVGKLKAMKLNQSIENIVSAGGANVQTGMPASVVDNVANQRIRGVYSAENSVVRVGIW
ncbi:hypothetical protein LTR97_011256 [Elasticomyces elasticus]|uniref:Azaphilone pigments biosynthesis cluster protein L N-terminal domain-containing protein n=1 Tax=Elasticomyces elasticus TaxID=574655 RepID=A0AAN7ZYT9_9PEZI|nr:hypothetical protein LTR97_011256 [Elasticomyces elasticus]